MGRALLLVAIYLFSLIVSAEIFPLAAVVGEPDASQNFVRNLVRKEISTLTDVDYEKNLSTKLFSILGGDGAHDILLVKGLTRNYGMNMHDALKAIDAAAQEATTVLWIVRTHTGGNDLLCRIMANHSDVAFVFPAGSDGTGDAIDPITEPHCLARNILIVTALDENQRELAPFANFGAGVRLAAPGVRVLVVGDGGTEGSLTGITPALTLAASRLSQYQEKAPGLLGADLIDAFLANEAIALPNIANHVAEGKAILSRGAQPQKQ